MQGQAVLLGVAGLILLLALIAGIALTQWRKSARLGKAQADQISFFEEKYKPIIDLDAAIAAAEQRLAGLTQTLAVETANHDLKLIELKRAYGDKKQIFDRLNHEVASLEGRLDFAELGIYQPKFQFDDSARYTEAIKQNLDKQKAMIAAGEAVICEIKWSVDGSESKGRTMTNRGIRLTLRAFNNECEVIISKATWKNFHQMQERIDKSRAALDKLNESNRLYISQDFVSLKHAELQLVYEAKLKKYEEQEKLREEKEREREDAKAQRELEAEARRAAKKEEQRREALMEARAELRAAGEQQRALLESKIAELERQLDAAHVATERAMSMAQQTRVGYVYVISNIGAFGEQVFKIGMTRRLEPLDRIKELGDASVPFPFDVHAMIFTEDAPALERALQNEFESFRVNGINLRKEFFRMPGADLKGKILSRFPDLTYIDQPDAEEYIQSLSKAEIARMASKPAEESFPAAL